MITPLQRTIHNLAMNGGSVIYNNGEVFKVDINEHGFNYFDKKVSLPTTLMDAENGDLKPLLHSFNKLTEPVLDGKVPIVELAKIAFPNGGWITTTESQTATNIKSFNKDKFIFRDGSFSCREAKLNGEYHKVPNQKQLFDQLNVWGFNTENLPEGTYVEIETLKIK